MLASFSLTDKTEPVRSYSWREMLESPGVYEPVDKTLYPRYLFVILETLVGESGEIAANNRNTVFLVSSAGAAFGIVTEGLGWKNRFFVKVNKEVNIRLYEG
jgi:hypothetical protein